MKPESAFTPICKKDSKEIIYKSNILVNGKYDISLVQARFIAYLSSFINAYDEDFYTYEIVANDVLDFLGVERKNIKWLVETLKRLQLTPILLKDDETGVAQTTFLSYFHFEKKTNKLYFRFDKSIKHCYVQLKNNFTSLRLGKYVEFTSVYTIKIYEWLEYNISLYDKYKNKMYSNVEIEVNDMKDRFAAKYAYKKGKFLVPKSYEQYKAFKAKVIEPAKRELKEKCDIYFSYDEIKNGNKVEKLIFNIYKNGERIRKDYANKKRVLLQSSTKHKQLAEEQIRRIMERTPNIKNRLQYEQKLYQKFLNGDLNYDEDLQQVLDKLQMEKLSKTI